MNFRRSKAKNVIPKLQPGYYLVHVDPKTLTDITQLSSHEAARFIVEIMGMRP